jgi:hypothetical protein
MWRNFYNARIVSSVLNHCFDPGKSFVDFGGGHGLFVRIMRDRGFDYYRDDKYCANLFANGFDMADSSSSTFSLATAFEVFEHFALPCDELAKLLQYTDTVLFSTEIISDIPPPPETWWYYGLDHGQHISFYTKKALSCLANKFGLQYVSHGSIHLFTKTRARAIELKFKVATHPLMAMISEILFHRKSFTQLDFKRLTGKEISKT